MWRCGHANNLSSCCSVVVRVRIFGWLNVISVIKEERYQYSATCCNHLINTTVRWGWYNAVPPVVPYRCEPGNQPSTTTLQANHRRSFYSHAMPASLVTFPDNRVWPRKSMFQYFFLVKPATSVVNRVRIRSPRRRWEDNTKMYIQEMGWGRHGLDCFGWE